MIPSKFILLVFCLIVGGLPAYYINKYLVNWLQPKQSGRNFTLYVLAAISAAILYAFIAVIVIWKFVLPH